MQFVTLLPSWGWLVIASIFFASGEYLSKRFALEPSTIAAGYALARAFAAWLR